MKQMKWIVYLIFPVVLFTSCQTSKSIQRQMRGISSELFYELTTPVYPGDFDTVVYLNPIDYSALLPYTTVKKKGILVVPLLIFDLVQNKYNVTLGEASLTQPYYGFLTDALLAQCKRSSRFNLKVRDDDAILPDSALILDVKIIKNTTTATMAFTDGLFIFPLMGDPVHQFSNWEVNHPVSTLEISACLLQQGNCLWKKTYSVSQDLSYQHTGTDDSTSAYRTCIDDMTECLSYTTKGIVENITQNLNLLMLQKPAN